MPVCIWECGCTYVFGVKSYEKQFKIVKRVIDIIDFYSQEKLQKRKNIICCCNWIYKKKNKLLQGVVEG